MARLAEAAMAPEGKIVDALVVLAPMARRAPTAVGQGLAMSRLATDEAAGLATRVAVVERMAGPTETDGACPFPGIALRSIRDGHAAALLAGAARAAGGTFRLIGMAATGRASGCRCCVA